jgi:hypothetical protein
MKSVDWLKIPGYGQRGVDILADLAAVESERVASKAWINDLQSGMYINCVYCGHRYGPDPGTLVAMADVLKTHIEKCPKHPLSAMKIRAEAALARVRELESGLRGCILAAITAMREDATLWRLMPDEAVADLFVRYLAGVEATKPQGSGEVKS